MTQIRTWLDFALQQMAAESYIHRAQIGELGLLQVLKVGNNNLPGDQSDAEILPGKTRMTTLQAQAFTQRYQVVDHHANDATGFSATLTFDTQTQQYTLSMRSTEYRDQVVGGDWERDGIPGADGEIKDYGFALAQLVSMERYWQELTTPGGRLAPGTRVNVTGYSLSGHLATVFTEMHVDRVLQTYTFNGAGRGFVSEVGQDGQPIEQTLRRMVVDLEGRLLAFDPSGTLFQSGVTGNIYGDARYDAARAAMLTQFQTIGTGNLQFFPIPGGVLGGIPTRSEALDKITQLIGHAVTGSDVQFVANSGIHAPSTSLLIEGQPILEGFDQQREFQYGNAPSITLLVDSLALQELLQKVDPNLTQAQIEGIFKAVSDQKADLTVLPGVTPLVEGETLEKTLDGLRKVFLGGVPDTQFGRQPGDFGNLTFRNSFYQHIQEVNTVLTSAIYRIDSLVGQPAGSISTIAQQDGPDDATGIAYRYALKELNPFVVHGIDHDTTQALYTRHNETGELALVNPDTGVGELTPQYLIDRAAFVAKKIEVNSNASSGFNLTHFHDNPSGYDITPMLSLRQMVFGDGINETLTGGTGADHFYGGSGDDQLLGLENNDYLEGNRGDDTLDGGSGADTMLGGQGNDTYIVDNTGEVVREYANSGIDLVRSSVTFTLDSQVENLTLTGTDAIDGTGNELNNILIGNDKINRLEGKGGQDTLQGGIGNDILAGGTGNNDLLEGGAGFDTYIYNAGDGADQIEDSDATGKIVFNGGLLQGGISTDGGATYVSLDGAETYVLSGGTEYDELTLVGACISVAE